MSGKEKLVVIGNGLAAVNCVEEILRLSPERFEITVFGEERHLTYNRVLLSHVLTGEKSLKDISLHDRGWYEERGIRIRTGTRVAQIRRKSRVAVTSEGDAVPYSRLILATGALPVIPNIPGADRPGVVSFRNVADCEAIRRLLGEGGARRAVVIGGGLLGLEAAYALKTIGADVTVVHLMARLMERQLDPASAGLLKEDMERLGVKVLLNRETSAVLGEGKAEAVRFKDGAEIPADLVVMSAGIRPNAELARASGIFCRRGIVVSDTMQTYDPAVYAVGECVEHRGRTFGLVASVFEQAKTLANHLAGDSRLTFRDRPASARLKVPGIDLYSAGELSEAADADAIEYSDRKGRVYKKVFLEDNRVKGVILYGDTSDGAALFSSLTDGADVSAARGRLLSGSSAADRGGASVGDIPDSAIVCGCNGVTKGMIVEAIEKKGLFTREEIKRETKASASCGGCAVLVDRILEATLGSDFSPGDRDQGICPCTKYTRDDVIKNIRERGLKSVKDVMETLGWESVGCDACRPAINYYLSMVWTDAEDDRTSRLINERLHANIQSDGRFSVVPRVYGGVITAHELRRLADAADRYAVPLIKITGGQRIGLFGVSREDLPRVWRDIGMPSGYAYGKALRTVKTCVGSRYCRYGTRDSLGLGIALEKALEGLWMPAKVKLGVNGCPRNCAEAGVKDVGIIGIKGAYEIYVGGSGGIETRAGELLATVKTDEEAVEVVRAFLQHYREQASYGERSFKWIRRAGLKNIKTAVVDDAENRKRLSLRLGEAREGWEDPWRARADNAALLR